MAFLLEEHKDDPDFKKFIDTAVNTAVDKSVGDLKGKNEELISEKRKMAEKFAAFEGIDIEQAKKAVDFMSNNEIAKLISEGKTDEALSSYTEKLRAQHDETISGLNEQLTVAKSTGEKYKSRFETSIVDSEVRKVALAEGILTEALDDVIARGRQVFTYGEDGSIEARDKDGNLLKKGDKILNVQDFVKDLPRYYWPASSGTGAGGGKKSDSDAQLQSAAEAGDHAAYRKLRKKK